MKLSKNLYTRVYFHKKLNKLFLGFPIITDNLNKKDYSLGISLYSDGFHQKQIVHIKGKDLILVGSL